MKNVDLITVTLDELGNVPPTPGMELTHRQVRYRVVHVKPPKLRSSRWRRKDGDAAERRWKLLVQKVD